MRTLLMALAILAASAACTGCAANPSTPSSAPSAPSAPSAADPDQRESSSHVDTSNLDTSPADANAASKREPAPAGLLVQMRAAAHPGYDRLVFEFGGAKPPPHHIQAVDEVRHDPSDRLIPVRGKRLLVIVFDGGTLDTTRVESDPAKARRYTGPDRIAPDLALLKEVAIAGDFEAVLSFGIGLSGQAGMEVHELSSPARLVIDFRGQ